MISNIHLDLYKGHLLTFAEELFVRRYYDEQGLILDVGCSVGHNMLACPGRKHGIDYDIRAVKTAKKRGLRARRCSVGSERFPFADRTFVGVDCRHLLEHLPNLSAVQNALSEMFRVLMPGGKILIEVPDCKHVRWQFFDNPEHAFPFVRKRLEQVVTDAGFEIISTHHSYRGIWGSKWLNRRGLLSPGAALYVQGLIPRAQMAIRCHAVKRRT
jgi:SAM-dependent methyltransferase